MRPFKALLVLGGLALALAALVVPRAALGWSRDATNWTFAATAVFVALTGTRLAGLPLRTLGLTHADPRGTALAVVGSLAMLAGLAAGPSPAVLDPTALLHGALRPALVEELLFRGFAFALLRHAGWSFPAAMLTTGALFGAFHLPGALRTTTAAQALTTAAYTAAGGAWFAWLYERWSRSLWIPITTHLCMNLWWTLYTTAPSSEGPGPGGLWGRVAAIVVISVGTAKLTAEPRDE